nr:reverse transcriptase domain-containing protein [Tanacetum cinerariifolium]
MLVTMGEGSGTPTEPHYTPTSEAPQSPQHELSSSSLPPVITKTIPNVIPTITPPLRQYTRRARIAQSSALPTVADEPASPLRDNSQGEAFLTGSMQHHLYELTDLCTRLQRQHTEMASKITAQDLEITILKAMIQLLEDKDGGGAEPFRQDAAIKGRSFETGEETGVEKSTKRGSDDTEELVNVLTSLDAATREIEEQIAREDQRMFEQIIRDAEITRIHAEEELQMLIDGLDRSNEVITKYLHEYDQAVVDLRIGEKIDLINELRKGLRSEQESAKKINILVEVPKESLKEMMQLVPVEETTHLKNEISRFTQRFEEAFGEAWERFKEMLRACPHHGFSELTQIDTFYNGLNEQDQDSLNATTGGNLLTVEKSCVICGGAHAYYDCIVTDSNQSSVCAATGTYNQVSSPNRASNQMTPPGFATVQNNQNRLNDQKLREKATNQMEKVFQIFHGLHFDISFADALLLMPKFASTIKSLVTNKEKLFELAKVPLYENCWAMLLKKLPEKLGDPGKFLIPCDFQGMDVCHALADLGHPKGVAKKWGSSTFLLTLWL